MLPKYCLTTVETRRGQMHQLLRVRVITAGGLTPRWRCKKLPGVSPRWRGELPESPVNLCSPHCYHRTLVQHTAKLDDLVEKWKCSAKDRTWNISSGCRYLEQQADFSIRTHRTGKVCQGADRRIASGKASQCQSVRASYCSAFCFRRAAGCQPGHQAM